MARGYSHEKYRRIIDNIRHQLPDATLGTDVIVAFPGETDAQFRDTLKLIEDVGFDMVNTAAYSPRPGTPAATWPDQLSEEVKVERLREVNELGRAIAEQRSQRYLNRVEEILVEAQNPKNPSQVLGRTRGNRLTFFAGEISELQGRTVPVRITQVRPYSLTGQQESCYQESGA